MLTDKQKHLYMLFKEINDLCAKHNIQYQLAGGSLIGAVRHRGFIPWDDDMDITMTRDNWERFIEVCKYDLPENRVLECQELNHNFHNVIARYTDTTSSAVHSTQVIADDAAGDMVDIICYDYLPDNDKSWKKYTKDITLYSDLINPCIVYSYRFCANRFRYGWYRLKCRIKGRDRVLDDLQKRMFRYKEEDCPYLVLRWGGTPLIFRKEIFGNSGSRVLFEDTLAQAPDFISDYIVEHYEDEWMFIPPATEQGGHKSIYSLDTDYKVIRKEINSFIDPEKEKKKFLRKKSVAMQVMAPWLLLKNLNILLTEKSKSRSFRLDFENKRAEIQDAYEKNNFAQLEDIFSGFISLQYSKEYFGRDDYDNVYKYRHPVILKIQSDMADKVVYTLFNRNNISKALRMITVYQQKNKATVFMEKIKEDIMFFRDTVHKVSVGNLGDAEKQSLKLYREHPYSVGILKLRIVILRKLNMREYTQEITDLINQAEKLSPDDGELTKYSLDLQYIDTVNPPIMPYIEAYHKTLNGIVRLEIQDIVTENTDGFKTVQDVEKALSVLPDNTALCKRYIDLVLMQDNPEAVYGLFDFVRKKRLVLNEEFQRFYKMLCSYFVPDENASKLFFNTLECQDYNAFLAIEEDIKALEDSPCKLFVLGEFLYKNGQTCDAVSCYIKGAKTKNSKLKFILKKRFEADLKRLRRQLDYADSVTHIDIEKNTEVAAADECKNRVRSAFFTKWAEPYGDIPTLSDALFDVGIIKEKIPPGALTAEYMESLMDEIGITADGEKPESYDELDPLKNKIDNPGHFDHNLTGIGDFNE